VNADGEKNGFFARLNSIANGEGAPRAVVAPASSVVPRAAAQPPAPFANPTIFVAEDEHRVVSETIAALAASPDVYAVNGALAEVDAQNVIHPMARERIRDVATASANFVKLDKKKDTEKPCHPPKWLAGEIFARKSLPDVRMLEGVVTTPILRDDGALVTEPGYDAASRLLLRPAFRIRSLPESPSRSDAADAAARVVEVFDEFPHRDPKLGKAFALSVVLTPFARHLVGCTPLFAVRGSRPGCGKGTLTDAALTIALGRKPARASWSAESEEQRKTLDGWVRRGELVGMLDNVTAPIGGPELERVATSEIVDVRILGSTQMASFKWRGILIANGNGLVFVGDMPRRVLMTDLVPLDDRPDQRSGWRFHPLVEYVQGHRAELTADALTILVAHARAGRPAPASARTWGSFERWTSVVADAVWWATETDPLDARITREAQTDSTNDALEALVRMWKAYCGGEASTAEFLTRVREDSEGNAYVDQILDQQVPLKTGKETKAGRLSTLLTRHTRRWTNIDGALLGFEKGDKGMYGVRWRVVAPTDGSMTA